MKKQRPAPGRTKAGSRPVPKHAILWLFLAAFAIRALLNCLVFNAPTVRIDESLYVNLARSLASGGIATYRGQPVNYPYLFYPMLLSPVYRLHRLLGGDVYRYVQLFNTLLITSSVFPVWLLGKRCTGCERTALTAAAFTALMPDMILGAFEMSECVIWPLSLWLICIGHDLLRGRQPLRSGLLAALLGALLFWTKPGAIVPAAVFLILNLIFALKDKRPLLPALLPAAVLAVLSLALLFLGRLLTPVTDSALGLYDKQLSGWEPFDLLVAAEGAVMTVFLFAYAAGGIFALLPAFRLRGASPERRRFTAAVLVSAAALILGTAVFIVPYDWPGGLGQLPLHLRYCSFLIPVCFLLSIAPKEEAAEPPVPEAAPETESGKGRKGAKAPKNPPARRSAKRPEETFPHLLPCLCVFLALVIFPGGWVGFVPGESAVIDCVSLAAFLPRGTAAAGILATVLMAGFTLMVILKLRKHSLRLVSAPVLGLLAAFLLFNNGCMYVKANPNLNPGIAQDAVEADRLLGTQTCLGVTQKHYDDIYTYALESRLNTPMHQVTCDQLFVKLIESDGVYVPFVPIDQPPNLQCHETPATDTFLLGQTVAAQMELSAGAQVQTTAHGTYTMVKVPEGGRLADSMIYGVDHAIFSPDTDGYLAIFDPDRSVGGKVKLRIRAYGSGTLTVGGVPLEVTGQPAWYELSVPYAKMIPLHMEGGSMEILSYSTLP